MTNPKSLSCFRCVWMYPTTQEGLGWCRFNPPTLMAAPKFLPNVAGGKSVNWDDQASAYPLVTATHYCSKFEAAPPLMSVVS